MSSPIIAKPKEFICPLTKDIMTDPVMSIHGHRFQRDAIVCWLQLGNASCPLTDKPMSYRDLLSDRALKSKIDGWKKQVRYIHDEGGAQQEEEEYEIDILRKVGMGLAPTISSVVELHRQKCHTSGQQQDVFVVRPTLTKLKRQNSLGGGAMAA